MSSKVALTNVRVFDKDGFSEPRTVVIDGELIGSDPEGARVIDCNGGFLLPGFIDAHVHLVGEHDLKQLASFGITTALDMTTRPQSLLDSLLGKKGLTDIRSAGIGATSPGSKHAQIPIWPPDELVSNPADAERFVKRRIAEGANFIKIISDIPGPDQETLNALVTTAHANNKLTIAHAVSIAAYTMAINAKVDIITHAPLDSVPDPKLIAQILSQGTVIIPTLTMMHRISHALPGSYCSYVHARNSVSAFHEAAIPILAGTDANSMPFSPATVNHGESLHEELELLVETGMENVEVLTAVTAETARVFGLGDRGVIEVGRRADLVLLDADPIKNIRATRSLKRVWVGGVEVRAASS